MKISSSEALYSIICWVADNGEPRSLDRVAVYCLESLLRESIVTLHAVSPTTAVSAECLETVREAASSVMGAACPY